MRVEYPPLCYGMVRMHSAWPRRDGALIKEEPLKIDGNKLRKARESARVSPHEAATIACMSESSISRIETKGGSLNFHICKAFAKAYGVNVKDLEAS